MRRDPVLENPFYVLGLPPEAAPAPWPEAPAALGWQRRG
jgi:hypothetical protein